MKDLVDMRVFEAIKTIYSGWIVTELLHNVMDDQQGFDCAEHLFDIMSRKVAKAGKTTFKAPKCILYCDPQARKL